MKKLIKLAIGETTIARLRLLLGIFSVAWIRVVVKSKLLIRLHYTCVSGAFDREAKAVLIGHLRFVENKMGSESVNYYLRRAIHRLEKGLIMQPRRHVFATDYISETVEIFSNAFKKAGNTEELTWAHDVLSTYFSVTDGSHPVISSAKEKFTVLLSGQVAREIFGDDQVSKIPRMPAIEAGQTVDYGSLFALARKRRSVRWYENRKVPREVIDNAILLAVQSPSACNRQPFEFLIFDEPEMVEKVSKLPMGTAGFDHNFPAVVVIVGRQRAYSDPRDRHVIYIDGSLAAMSFMYALETQGVSSCPINWPDIGNRERAATKLLKLQPDERIIMFISVGYARQDGLVPYSQKIALQEARRFNPPTG